MNQYSLNDNSKGLKINFDFKTLVTTFLVFAFTIISVGGVSAFPSKLRMPLVIAVGVITAAVIVFRRKKVLLTTPSVLMILTTLYITLSLTYTIDPETTLKMTQVYVCSSLLLLVDYPESLFEKTIKAIEVVCIVIAVSIILSSFIENLMIDYFWFIVNPSRHPEVNQMMIQEIRWSGSYSGFAREKGEAAFIMNIGIAVYFAKYFSREKFSKTNMFFLLIMFWALILTSKRMLFLTPIITMSALLLISRKKGRLMKILPIILIALCGMVVVGSIVPQFSHLFERFADKDSMTSLTGRVDLWPFCFDMLEKEPLFGMGIGSFNQYLFNQNVIIQGEVWKHFGHNVYYEFLGELGIVGCVLLFGGLFTFYGRTIMLMRSDETNENQKFLLVFSVSVQTICLVYCASGNVLLYPQEIVPWFICLAITATISNKLRREKEAVRKLKYTEAV